MKSAPLIFLLKAAITLGLFIVIFANVDLSVIARRLSSGTIVYILPGILLLMVNGLFVAIRWWLLLRRFGFDGMSPGYTIAVTFASLFAGQVMLGSMGADAARGWLCYRRGARPSLVVASLATDRLLAMLALVVVMGMAWLWQVEAVDRGIALQVALLGGVVLAAAVMLVFVVPAATAVLAKWWTRLRHVRDLLATMRSAVLSPPGAIGVGLSCAVHVLTIGSVICSAYGFGIPLNPIVAGLIVPVAILVSSLPISIGGWGVREASLSFGLTMFGIAPEDGTLLGLTLGLSQLAASLPGGIAILLLDRAEPHGGPAPRLFG